MKKALFARTVLSAAGGLAGAGATPALRLLTRVMPCGIVHFNCIVGAILLSRVAEGLAR